MRIILVTPALAEALREATAGQDHRLDPRPIAAGPHAGKEALPERVLEDPAFAGQHAELALCPIAEIDPDAAWPDES